jgi:hypothetical protein
VTYLKVLPQNLPGGTEENDNKLRPEGIRIKDPQDVTVSRYSVPRSVSIPCSKVLGLSIDGTLVE